MTPELQRARAQLKVWWIIWTAVLVGLCMLWWLFGFLELRGNEPHANPLLDLVGLVPLFVSVVIRWLVLPRDLEMRRAFTLFIVGVSLAEACGVLGIFLGGPYRDDLFLLGALGIAQYLPFFARRYLEPKPQGFIPNN
jgi:hypothetical protein